MMNPMLSEGRSILVAEQDEYEVRYIDCGIERNAQSLFFCRMWMIPADERIEHGQQGVDQPSCSFCLGLQQFLLAKYS